MHLFRKVQDDAGRTHLGNQSELGIDTVALKRNSDISLAHLVLCRVLIKS